MTLKEACEREQEARRQRREHLAAIFAKPTP
jgi:hypothetical protein